METSVTQSASRRAAPPSDVQIDCFTTGLDELSPRKQGDVIAVLRHMEAVGRVSIFDVTATQDLAETVTRVESLGYAKLDNSCGYPWFDVRMHEAGQAALRATS
jgi:hypothetical protein